jgi:hypothetical protein
VVLHRGASGVPFSRRRGHRREVASGWASSAEPRALVARERPISWNPPRSADVHAGGAGRRPARCGRGRVIAYAVRVLDSVHDVWDAIERVLRAGPMPWSRRLHFGTSVCAAVGLAPGGRMRLGDGRRQARGRPLVAREGPIPTPWKYRRAAAFGGLSPGQLLGFIGSALPSASSTASTGPSGTSSGDGIMHWA